MLAFSAIRRAVVNAIIAEARDKMKKSEGPGDFVDTATEAWRKAARKAAEAKNMPQIADSLEMIGVKRGDEFCGFIYRAMNTADLIEQP